MPIKDEMYEGLASKGLQKNDIPPAITDPNDKKLLAFERTTDEHAFSYFLRLTGADHYFILLKFIEVRDQ